MKYIIEFKEELPFNRIPHLESILKPFGLESIKLMEPVNKNALEEAPPEKVYCNECKFFFDPQSEGTGSIIDMMIGGGNPVCKAEGNMGSWERKDGMHEPPWVVNKNNNCPYYESLKKVVPLRGL